MHAIPRRFPSGQLSIFAALLCLAVLAGCAPGATGPSPEQNCYPHSAPIPGPVVFHPTAGQAGLYAVARSGIYRFSSAGGTLTPIWLYRMHGCAQLTPTVVGHIAGPLYEQPTIASDVTVAGGMIYFSAWETAGSWIDLYAVHADTGDLVWKKRITDLSQIGGLLVLNNLLYIETGDAVHSLQLVNIIQALDVRDGSVRWTYRYSLSPDDTGMDLDSAGDGELYITGPHALFALDATNGQKLWRVNLPPGQNFPVASLLDGTLYVTSSAGCFNCVVQPGSSLVYALDPATGTQRWQSQRFDGFLTPPMEAQSVVYVGSQDGHLHALRASDGKQLWTSAASGELHITPQIANGLVIVSTALFLGTDDPNTTPTHVLTFDATTGQQRWSYTFAPNEADGYQPLLVGNGMVYTVSGDMRIDVLQATTGKLLQQYSVLLTGPDLGLTLAA